MVEATLYKAEWCEPCHDVLAHLDKRGVAVHEIDISEDPEAGKGFSDIPVTVFPQTGEVVRGYNRSQLDAAIGRAGGSTFSASKIAGVAIAAVGIAAGIYLMVHK